VPKPSPRRAATRGVRRHPLDPRLASSLFAAGRTGALQRAGATDSNGQHQELKRCPIGGPPNKCAKDLLHYRARRRGIEKPDEGAAAGRASWHTKPRVQRQANGD
jgi:hypothetical protein